MLNKRCSWCSNDEIYIHYHDDEWGIPVYDDRKLFEMLILEGCQAGLSWISILKRRDNYRKAYDNFDPEIMSKWSDEKIQQLLNNPGIIRNKLKVNAAKHNAIAFLNVVGEYGAFKDFIWSFVNHKPIINHWKTLAEVPANTEISEQMSQSLKKKGFKFVGSTICYAYMQAVGMVNDHTTDCYKYSL